MLYLNTPVALLCYSYYPNYKMLLSEDSVYSNTVVSLFYQTM